MSTSSVMPALNWAACVVASAFAVAFPIYCLCYWLSTGCLPLFDVVS